MDKIIPGDLVTYHVDAGFDWYAGCSRDACDYLGIVIAVYEVSVKLRNNRQSSVVYCDVLFSESFCYVPSWDRITAQYHRKIAPERLKKVA